MTQKWINLTKSQRWPPAAPSQVDAVLSIVNALDAVQAPEFFERELERIRDNFAGVINKAKHENQKGLEALSQLLVDLKKRGWQLRLKNKYLEGLPPEQSKSISAERADRKTELSGRRFEQLREPSTRRFVQGLERGRVTIDGRRSIYDLMRDGRGLSQVLRNSRKTKDDPNPLSSIQPYLQCVTTNELCHHTGLVLTDVWRYFRHTWSNPYDSIPGRSMLLLLRDAGALHHPVMGIGALSSATAQLDARDRFLGWTAETFTERCLTERPAVVTNWIQQTVSVAIDEIYKTDFLSDGLVSTQEMNSPSDGVLAALRTEAKRARLAYRALETREKERKPDALPALDPDDHWAKQATSLLFRSKRAEALASVLTAKQVLYGGLEFKNPAWCEGFFRLIKIARSKTIGTAMADLTVCGALPPYNELLAGKLMAMLAMSPEVIAEYERRYKGMASVIASSMAGRQICRPAKLAVIGTTSLYGVRPCQYDRLSMPAQVLGGAAGTRLGYKFLEHRTAGYGTFQFSRRTKEALKHASAVDGRRAKVNNRFGEGASPKFRAIRDGLDILGLDSDVLLQHGRKKSMYIASLIADPASYLLGLSMDPTYLFDSTLGKEGTVAVSDWWKHRWASPRLARSGTYALLERHNHIHPISHGARVILPDPYLDQPRLFTE
jgi:hypothetical protein